MFNTQGIQQNWPVKSGLLSIDTFIAALFITVRSWKQTCPADTGQ